MDKWIDVVTHPLGLAGFALFLVFATLSRLGASERPAWLLRTFVAMALISLGGGLWLSASKQDSIPEADSSATHDQNGDSSVTQTSSGDKSPNVSGVTGNVTIIQSGEDTESASER